jgi:hypothetical protein
MPYPGITLLQAARYRETEKRYAISWDNIPLGSQVEK